MRIVGGALGGRRLKGLAASQHTRPSSERLREGLFSALQARGLIDDASVLDLFAGTGALGLEALSRGARRLVAVDSSVQAARCVADNARALGLADRVRVLRLDLSRASSLQRLTTADEAGFGLLLCDPPYAQAAAIGPLLAGLAELGALLPAAVAAVEHAADAAPSPAVGFELLSAYCYGGSGLSLWQRTR
jgi:16S rRNA (guanine966-N2)-methyltransferase